MGLSTEAAPLEMTNSKETGVVPGTESDVFSNASTIASWLQAQDPGVRVKLANDVFARLLHDASHPRVVSSKASVKLCGFVQLCSRSDDEGLRDWAFSRATSLALFDFYIEWNERHQHRSMKLVLDWLVASFSLHPDPQLGAAVRAAMLETLVGIVSRQSVRSLVKSSLHSLVHFLGKGAVRLADISATYRRVKPSAADCSDLDVFRSFIGDVFSWMNLHHVCPVAGKFLVQLFRELRELTPPSTSDDTRDWAIGFWLECVQDALATNPDLLESIKNYVLAPLFRAERACSLKMLDSFSRHEQVDAMSGELGSPALLQLAGLEVGRKCGLVDDPGRQDTETQPGEDAIAMNKAVLEIFLVHPSHAARSSALSLLVSSPFTTRPLSPESLGLLQRHLATYHSDFDTKFRYEMLGYSREMINRVKNVISVAKRGLARSGAKPLADTGLSRKRPAPEELMGDEAEMKEVLARHESFLQWYMGFLKGELIPTASYQRHITALKALLPVLRIERRTSGLEESIDAAVVNAVLADPAWIRLVLDLIMDPFDDVRETAATILSMLPRDVVLRRVDLGPDSPVLLSALEGFCVKATRLAGRTGRADHGNGAARSRGLLCSWAGTWDERLAILSESLAQLEKKLSSAAHSLGHAAMEESVHVDFASLGYVWQALRPAGHTTDRAALDEMQRRILKNCKHVWDLVQHVLCDDSPEGLLPEELEEVDGLDTKDLLSYSFRAVHESSNLMRILVSGLSRSDDSNPLRPPPDVFDGIGSLTFTQLSRLRHRGAFSTVSSTFTTCCQLTRNLKAAFPDLPKSKNHLYRWYEGTIDCIMNQASTTRRSAGIPALMTGILAAEAASPSFGEAFEVLVGIAKDPARVSETDGSNLPQVHALNCLRALFRSSLLGKRAEAYLAPTLQLATDSLRSEVWAIRNCGLLLLRSLIDCLFGTGESKSSLESGWDGHTVRISYVKYPSLPGLLLRLLDPGDEPGTESRTAEAVFPALDIIRRAGPPDEHRDQLYRHIEGYLGSRLWHVREMAARTLCSFLLREDWAAAVRQLLRRSEAEANRLHGALLTTKFVISRKAETDAEALQQALSNLMPLLAELSRTCQVVQRSSQVRAAVVEVYNLVSSIGFPGLLSKQSVLPRDKSLLTDVSGSSALLQTELGLSVVRECAEGADVSEMRRLLGKVLDIDVDTACKMLEAIPEIWASNDAPGVRLQLCALYLDVHRRASHAEPRTLALQNLAGLMDSLLRERRLDELPSDEALEQLWAEAQRGDINPALSQATVIISGTLMAIRVLRGTSAADNGRQLRAWAAMIVDELDVDNPFDIRFAAVLAIRFFSLPVGPRTDPQYLPYYLALYDALNDDDDEVRDVAAAAAAPMVDRRVAALEAADLLIDRLQAHFKHVEEFWWAVARRMAGQPSPSSPPEAWEPAQDILDQALRFDDSLFAVEEQNLFVDEIRESIRWRRVYADVNNGDTVESPRRRLRAWTTAGLQALTKQAADSDDGPLGWSSQQQVFAICARVLLCGQALEAAGDAEVGDLLRDFVTVGKNAGVHGTLLQFAGATP